MTIDNEAGADARPDPHLMRALKHAPDAAVEPPIELDDAVRNAAHAALARSSAAAADARRVRSPTARDSESFVSRLMRWLDRPALASALGIVAVSTLVVTLWRSETPSAVRPTADRGADAVGSPTPDVRERRDEDVSPRPPPKPAAPAEPSIGGEAAAATEQRSELRNAVGGTQPATEEREAAKLRQRRSTTAGLERTEPPSADRAVSEAKANPAPQPAPARASPPAGKRDSTVEEARSSSSTNDKQPAAKVRRAQAAEAGAPSAAPTTPSAWADAAKKETRLVDEPVAASPTPAQASPTPSAAAAPAAAAPPQAARAASTTPALAQARSEVDAKPSQNAAAPTGSLMAPQAALLHAHPPGLLRALAGIVPNEAAPAFASSSGRERAPDPQRWLPQLRLETVSGWTRIDDQRTLDAEHAAGRTVQVVDPTTRATSTVIVLDREVIWLDANGERWRAALTPEAAERLRAR